MRLTRRAVLVMRDITALQLPFTALKTSHAFHSAMMDPVIEPFRQLVAGARLSPPRRRFISSTTGLPIRDAEATSTDRNRATMRAMGVSR